MFSKRMLYCWEIVSALVILSLAMVIPKSVTAQQATLTVWNQETPPNRVAALQSLLDAFSKQYHLTAAQTPVSWGDVYAKLPAAVAAGNAPDVGETLPSLTVLMTKMQALVPVDSLVQQLNAKYHFSPAMLAPYHYQGHYWSVPLYGLDQVLLYNNKLFQQAGIKSAPSTWSQLLSDAKRLTKNGVYGIGLPTSDQFYASQNVWDFMATNRVSIYDKKGKVTFNTPQVIQTLAFLKQLAPYSPPDSSNWQWPQAALAFETGKTAMFVYNTDMLDTIHWPSSQLKGAPVPMPPGGVRANLGYPFGLYITKHAQQTGMLGASEKLISFLLDPKRYNTVLDMQPGLFLPIIGAVNMSQWQSNKYIAKYPQPVQTELAALKTSVIYGFEHGAQPGAGALEGSQLLAKIAQKVYFGQMSPAQAAAWGQAQIEALAK